MAHILLIEDDPAVARAMELGLQRLGHSVRHESDGSSDLAVALSDIDVVVLDIGLPGIDGFEICRRIRVLSSTPIVMLTARSDEVDIVAGLESGADDYIVKPTSPRVLDARIKAVLRRITATVSTNPGANASEAIGDLVLDREALELRRNGVAVTLSPTEMRLVLVLVDNAGRVLSRSQLLQAAWDQGYLGDSRTVDTAIQRLRAKIEPDPSNPTYIETVRGFGYRFSRQ